MRTVYWVRNDLRLRDNEALAAFARDSKDGILIWCPTPSYLRAGIKRKNFVRECLSAFSNSLLSHGQTLYTGSTGFAHALSSLLVNQSIERVVFTQEHACEEVAEEKEVHELGQKHQFEVLHFDQNTLVSETALPFTLANMPFVFTDFRKKVERSLNVKMPMIMDPTWQVPGFSVPAQIRKLESFPQETKSFYQGGETAAGQRLQYYFDQTQFISTYKETRNGMIGHDYSTRFSAWINQGCLSARTVYHDLKAFEVKHGANESTYWLVFELLWRDYFKFLSRKNGKKIFLEEGLSGKHTAPRDENVSQFEKWKTGKTEDAFTNANMTELNETGWMSNRGRQNVASYLIHQLQVPWTWGAAYFEEKLIDYDPDLNWGNWLYASGRGTDPRARIFSPEWQAKIYDPNGEYQKLWTRSSS